MASRITVVGSINMDLVVRCDQLPGRGETVSASDLKESPGGKGANQAVAAARAGGSVSLVGRVGDDAFASTLLARLAADQIYTPHVIRTLSVSSGVAVVAVERSGENSILVVPGANGCVTAMDVEAAADLITGSDLLLMQLEIPTDAILRALSIAQAAGVPTILDPAPAPPELPPELLRVDVLCPNQVEAAAILGRPIETIEDANAGVQQLRQLGVHHPIITMGRQGAVLDDGSGTRQLAPFPVETVDTTAAGDAFAGALAVRLAEGAPVVESARFACAAGALAATRLGAQAAMPTRAEIDSIL